MQVRRKADPAKNLVKGWIQNWKDMMEVQQETSHKELSGDDSKVLGMMSLGSEDYACMASSRVLQRGSLELHMMLMECSYARLHRPVMTSIVTTI